jgi:hypothetical protein
MHGDGLCGAWCYGNKITGYLKTRPFLLSKKLLAFTKNKVFIF